MITDSDAERLAKKTIKNCEPFMDIADKEVIALAEKVLELLSRQRWVPVSERLPDSEGRYLIVYKYGSGNRIFIGDWCFDDGEYFWSGLPKGDVTHWAEIQPLPQPPEPPKEEL